jgi:hypothetical protein
LAAEDDYEENLVYFGDGTGDADYNLPDLDDDGAESDGEPADATIAAASKHSKSSRPPVAKKRKIQLVDRLSSGSENSDLDSSDDEDVKVLYSAKWKEEHKRQQQKTPKRTAVHQYLHEKGNAFCAECYTGNTVPYFSFEISTDGVALHSNSSKTASWPIMASLLFVSPCIHLKDKIRFYLPRNSKPVIVGFFYGTAKPKANDLFRCMFKDMQLAKRRRLCTMHLKFVIADGPGRNLAKGNPPCTAYCGCERCDEEGVKLASAAALADEENPDNDDAEPAAADENPDNNTSTKNKKKKKQKKKKKAAAKQTAAGGNHIAIIKTKDLNLRTQKNYLDKKMYFNVQPDRNNVLLKYALKSNGEFDIIHSVPLDSMHTVFHCALSWIIEGAWIKGTKVKGGKFSKKLMRSIEDKLKKVQGCFPSAIEASVGTKAFEKFNVTWSCSDKRIFLLYVAIVVLNDELMDEDAYGIILSFQHAIMLICGSRHCSQVPLEHLRKAKEHLLYVVEKCQEKYGLDFPRYAFHCILHIVDDLAANKCRLDYCSMFRYENGMKFFSNVLNSRGGQRVQAQIRNALMRKRQSQFVLPPM